MQNCAVKTTGYIRKMRLGTVLTSDTQRKGYAHNKNSSTVFIHIKWLRNTQVLQ